MTIKKYLTSLTGSAALLLTGLSGHSQAADLSFSLGAYSWKTEASGGITGDSVIGPLDLSLSTFDQEPEYNNVFFATLEHPVPVLPNVKLAYTTLESYGTNGVYIYPGFSPIEISNGLIDLSHTDITGYYKVLDNIIELDIGLTVRVFDGSFELRSPLLSSNSGRSEIQSELALLYAKTAVNLPLGFQLEAELNAGDDGKQSGTDYSVLAKYRSPIGLGLAAGYRSFNADLESKSTNNLFSKIYTDVTYKGPMFYVFYSF
jgi:outer membrane protein